MGYEWLALAAASLWAVAALISVKPASHLGAFAYSRWRMFTVTLMLAGMSFITGGWQSLSLNVLPLLALSGLVGIFIGDTALYACMNRLGPRRSNLLFCCHALFSALLGLYLFDEQLTGSRLIGALLIFAGVMLAICFGKRDAQHQWEKTQGLLSIGIGLGLLAALCQSLGVIIAKPVMMNGQIDAISASAMRMASALAAHLVLRFCHPIARPLHAINGTIFGLVAINGFLAMAVGMTLILLALRYGDVGMVAVLSSTTPVLLLPLLWCHSHIRPSAPAWLGALMATLGSALVLAI